MNISVFGLGYVGIVSSACLAKEHNKVIGVDINQNKVDLINNGVSPIIEPGLDVLIKNGVQVGNLKATMDVSYAINETDLSIVCVGTPSQKNGSLDLTFVQRVCEQIGKALKQKEGFHHIVLRSTVLPGTTEQVCIPIMEATSEKTAGLDFGVAFNPEFLREGSAIKDFYDPPKTVIGSTFNETQNKLIDLFSFLKAPIDVVPFRVAEAVKYADNAFHALKVSFANEIGAFCKAYGIDSHEVMRIFVKDKKLNLSPYYLKPGPPFGGSCLPKDVRALIYALGKKDIISPLLTSIIPSNEIQKERVFEAVKSLGKTKIGILGLSFKAETDDLRESPTINLVEKLIGKGFSVSIYDPILNTSKLVGSNRAFIKKYLPHIDKLLVKTVQNILQECDVIVVTRYEEKFNGVFEKIRSNQVIVDLVKLPDEIRSMIKGVYHGLAW